MDQNQGKYNQPVGIEFDGIVLDGDLSVPPGASSIVVFAHGSGSGRFSPRNRQVALRFNEAGMATLLLDLLTPREQSVDDFTRELRFDIPLLSERLAGAVDWLAQRQETADLAVGLYGASTGAAAALIAAAQRPQRVAAVVSRGGRVDLAAEALPRVRAPVLMLVGGEDFQVLDLNRRAADLLEVEHRLHVVPGASHLFEEPGKLEEVAAAAIDWFSRHLGGGKRERAAA